MVGTTQSLADYSAAARARIEAALDGYWADAGAESGCPAQLRAAIRYALLGGGKRLRGILVLMAAEACDGTADAALPAACAVEMIHAYSLVHDDLPAMDNDDLRRGRPSCHKAFGEATAILVGDALLTRAFEIVAGDVRPAETAARCCRELAVAAGAEGMVGGQAVDVAGMRPGATLVDLERLHAGKTGAMLVASLRLGGLIAGASRAQLEALAEYGRHLGVAFQVADDLLDVRGDEAAVGKRVGKDAALGKLTYPALVGVERSEHMAREFVDRAVAALAPLGPAAGLLDELALWVVERDC